MKRFLGILLLVISLLVAVLPLSAQSEPLSCDITTLKTVIDSFTTELGKLKNETDVVKVATELEDLALTAARLRATCDGLAFSGKSQKLIGPVEIPVGTYRAVAKTNGYMVVTVTPADGKCGQGQYMDSNLFLVMDGQAKTGAETLFISQGCTALIEVSNVQADWTLEFNNLTTGK